MSTREPFPALVCKHCRRAIPLPPAMHPDISEHLGAWPTGAVARNFLCRQCKRVYEYSAQNVQGLPVGRDPRRVDARYNVVSILLQCGVQGCASLLRIRTVAASDEDLHEMVPGELATAQAHEIHCDRGHTLSGPIRMSGMAFDILLDDEWEISS